MNPFYKIGIDRVDDNYISGWCFHRFRKLHHLKLALYCNDECLGEMKADRFREDLLALGIHPTGKCGFKLITNRRIAKGEVGIKLIDSSSDTILLEVDSDNFSINKRPNPFDIIKSVVSSLSREKETILFMHIPKTAGTSFNTIIRSMMPKRPSISHIEAYGVEMFPSFKNRYRYISGHLRYGIFKKYFCDDYTKLYTIVREPFSHLHSHLKWVKSSSSNGDTNNLKYRKRAIYDLSLRIRDIDFSKNDQIKKFVSDVQGVEAAFFDNKQTRHFLNQRVERVTNEDLKTAIENSKKFYHIGLTERYEEFIKEFSNYNNLRIPQDIGQLNRSRSEQLFDINDQSLRELLHPLVCHDLELYDHINEKF